jgi:ethanolamine utilization microcompartment shell protein EutS
VSELKVNKVTPATGTQVELEAATVLVDGTLRAPTVNNPTGVAVQHNGSTKIATTSTGVTVTGTVAATAFSGDGSALTGVVGTGAGGSSSTGALTLQSDSGNAGSGDIAFKVGSVEAGRIYRTSGDVAFDGTTLYVDASANSVGIGNNAPAVKLDVTGDIAANNVTIRTGQLVGGIGAESSGGTLNWNDSSNARSGSGYTLLLPSTSSNGPLSLDGGDRYFHPFSFEYDKKDGSGNLTQFAIPYTNTVSGIHFRTRISGTWASWRSLVTMPNVATPAISVDTSSNVGILDTSPSYPLDVNGAVRATGRFHANAGIQFLAAAAAQSDANCLDDYEEGTWTPVYAVVGGTSPSLGTVTYGTRTAKYTKVGRLVTFSADISVTTGPTTSGGTGSKGVISGLPFSASGPGTCHVGWRTGTWGTNKPDRGYVSGTNIQLVTSGFVELGPTDLGTTTPPLSATRIILSGSYFIS